MCRFALCHTILIRISTLSKYHPPHRSSLAPSFVHTRFRSAKLGLDRLDTFGRERQAFMGAFHVVSQSVLLSKAVLPIEPAADDMAWEPFRILAMNGSVVSFHVVFALCTDLTAVIFAGEDQLPVLVTSLLAEMTFFMANCHTLVFPDKRYVAIPSASSNTAGYEPLSRESLLGNQEIPGREKVQTIQTSTNLMMIDAEKAFNICDGNSVIGLLWLAHW